MFKGKLALIIDDSETERYMLKKELSEINFRVEEAKDAFVALSMLDQEDLSPDIIFMDANMPGMTGYQAIRQVRMRERMANVPIVMCTGDATEDNIQWAMHNGASEVFEKPVSKDILIFKLNKVFKS